MIGAIQAVLSESPQACFWKCYYRPIFKGVIFNNKRVYPLYCRLGLNLKRSVKKTQPEREEKPLSVVNKPNIPWAMDFMHNSLYCGNQFRTLNIIDGGTRECLAIEVDSSLPASRIIRVFDRLKEDRGQSQHNGPQLISVNLPNYCEYDDIKLCHIQPGKPQRNGFIERFNGSFRREF